MQRRDMRFVDWRALRRKLRMHYEVMRSHIEDVQTVLGCGQRPLSVAGHVFAGGILPVITRRSCHDGHRMRAKYRRPLALHLAGSGEMREARRMRQSQLREWILRAVLHERHRLLPGNDVRLVVEPMQTADRVAVYSRQRSNDIVPIRQMQRVPAAL